LLEDATEGGHFGLVILLREGVAAWMTHAKSSRPPALPTMLEDRPSVTALIAGDVHADMARVLANMVMTTHEERCA
jgi:hypothetical protein